MQVEKYDFFLKEKNFDFFPSLSKRGDPLILKLSNHLFKFVKKWLLFKWPHWDLENVKRNKVMKFGNSYHQIVKMPDWILLSGPDLTPLSRNSFKMQKTFHVHPQWIPRNLESLLLLLMIFYKMSSLSVAHEPLFPWKRKVLFMNTKNACVSTGLKRI